MIELIPYDSFGRLRLVNFAGPETEIHEVSNWEYEDDEWVGEAIGFSEWLRLAEDPEVLRSLALELDQLPQGLAAKVLAHLKLPLARGMELAEVNKVLGEPSATFDFRKDRFTNEYAVGREHPYTVSCTFARPGGLVYLSVRAPTPRRLAC